MADELIKSCQPGESRGPVLYWCPASGDHLTIMFITGKKITGYGTGKFELGRPQESFCQYLLLHVK